ncbi:hypothetical protein BB561_000383 [Smittium simulii]|uniref:Uncharacterized protein n=1 Tax=Smittium simulii TaxID=133385 RepID=A0A2T9YZC2_9FUNG|nr:hypothetical protein BB561_000383 [Smittium simulii]
MGTSSSKIAKRSFARPQSLKTLPELQPTKVRAQQLLQNLTMLLDPKITNLAQGNQNKSNLGLETIKNRNENDDFVQHGVKNRLQAATVYKLLEEYSNMSTTLQKAEAVKKLASKYNLDEHTALSLTTFLSNPPRLVPK